MTERDIIIMDVGQRRRRREDEDECVLVARAHSW